MILIRRPLSRPRRWLMLFVLAILPVPPDAVRPVRQIPDLSGCRSVGGDNWFVEDIAFAPPTIAPGVLIEPTGQGVRLSNTTDTPLYLVEAGEFSDLSDYAPAAPISLTAPLLVRNKVVDDAIAAWRFDRDLGAYQWYSYGPSYPVIVAQLDYSSAWLPGYSPIVRYGDNRPADVALPSAAYTLRVIYGDELFSIPVTVSARLDPDYDPNQERNERERCASRPNFGALLAMCIGVPLAILLSLSLLVIFGEDRRYG